MHDVAAMPDIYITVLTGTRPYFSAYARGHDSIRAIATRKLIKSHRGADVGISRPTGGEDANLRRQWLRNFVSNNLHITHAFYTHPKILITALNGPAIGLSAALIAFSDFIYAMPHTFLLTPFTFDRPRR